MKRLLTVCALLALACPAAAGPIVLSGDTSLHAWTVADLNGGAFWANRSYDRNGLANVGYYLSRTPGSDVSDFYKDSPAAFLPYLGDGATTFVWDRAPVIQYLQGVTDWTDTLSVVPSGAGYALVFRSPNDTWLSTELDRGRSHFAVFQAPHAWYVGMEDATWDTPRTADWDYNDMIVRIPERDVPDGGGTLLLMAIGAGLCLWRRR